MWNNPPDGHDHRSDPGAVRRDGRTTRPLRVCVLGPLHVLWRPDQRDRLASAEPCRPELDITDFLQSRPCELLAHLVAHPHGAEKEALVTDLWPNTPRNGTASGASTNAPANTVSRLRAGLDAATRRGLPAVVLTDRNGRYRLDPRYAEADLWDLHALLDARRENPQHNMHETLDALVARYTAPFAAGVTASWATVTRDTLRHEVGEAVLALSRALVDHDGNHVLDRLTAACAHDPQNQALARETMRVQAYLGRTEDIPRTLTLLRARLARHHDQPDPETVAYAGQLVANQPGLVRPTPSVP